MDNEILEIIRLILNLVLPKELYLCNYDLHKYSLEKVCNANLGMNEVGQPGCMLMLKEQ